MQCLDSGRRKFNAAQTVFNMFVDMLGWLWHMPINTNMKSVKPTGYGHFAYGYALVSLEAKKNFTRQRCFSKKCVGRSKVEGLQVASCWKA